MCRAFRHGALGLALLTAWGTLCHGADGRFIENGVEILRDGYADQPYVVALQDGRWLCITTVSATVENAPERHLVLSWSGDQGETWTAATSGVEPPEEMRQPSWATLFVNEFGRVYAFYNLNREEGRGIIYAYRHSDDHGHTWSERSYLPIRETAMNAEFENASSWGIDPPQKIGDSVFFAFSKYGGPNRQGEGWIFRSPNLWSERDADRIEWEMWPEGDYGIRSERVGYLQEEHNLVPLSDGTLYMAARSLEGYVVDTVSHDMGETWTEPDFATYADGERRIKNPRALARVWRCENGHYLLWHHNHDGRDVPERNKNRTPAWVAGGIEQDGRILWSQPEILLYTFDPPYNSGMSYPELIEKDGRYWVTQTQKKVARINEIDPDLLNGLWQQHQSAYLNSDDLLVEMAGPIDGEAFDLPSLSRGESFSIEMKVHVDDLNAPKVLLDMRRRDRMGTPGQGLVVESTGRGTLILDMNDGRRSAALEIDDGLLEPGRDHYVAFVVDGAARIITAVVDDRLCDGGEERQYGWQLFDRRFGDVEGGGTLVLDEAVRALRVYGRALRTSEAISHGRYLGALQE